MKMENFYSPNYDRKKRAYQVLSNNARKKSNMLWDQLPENYFQKNTTKKIIRHTELFRLMLKDGVAIKVDKEGDYLRLDLLTMNRPGLFYQVCELFHLLMLETIDADILTSKDNNYAINSYLITTKIIIMKLYCSNCGHPNSYTSQKPNFCINCGTNFNTGEAPQQITNSNVNEEKLEDLVEIEEDESMQDEFDEETNGIDVSEEENNNQETDNDGETNEEE